MDGPERRAVLTGLGAVAPFPFSAALSSTARPGEAQPSTPEITGFETPEGAPAFGFECEFSVEQELPRFMTFLDRTSALALAAAKRALADAGLLEANSRPKGLEIGCAYGTTFGCLEAMGLFWKKVKSGNPKFAPPLIFTHGYANSPAALLCIEYGLRGSAAVFAGEELAGLEALLFAHDQLAAGAADCLLVCAGESLTRALHAHLFAAGRLRLSGRWTLETAEPGLVPGEGAACLVLETAASAVARGKRPLAALTGVSIAADSAGRPAAWEEAARAVGGPPAGAAWVALAAPWNPEADKVERAFWSRFLSGPPARLAAPKLLTGEAFSVSPLWNVLCAAAVLSGRSPSAGFPGVPPDAPPVSADIGCVFAAAQSDNQVGLAKLTVEP
jgi:3-oxoacyl-(acyl-carrier-protein) synthase